MRKIFLYGELGKKYGKEHRLEVSSVGESIRALECIYPGFRRDISVDRFYEVKKGISHLGKDELTMVSPHGDYHIIPVVEGAKTSKQRGVVFAVIGLALIASGWGGAAGLLGNAKLAGFAMSVGTGLAFSGAAMFISPVIKPPKDVDAKDSYVFTSAQNISKQGGVVPVVYGEFEIGSTIISTSLEATNA